MSTKAKRGGGVKRSAAAHTSKAACCRIPQGWESGWPYCKMGFTCWTGCRLWGQDGTGLGLGFEQCQTAPPGGSEPCQGRRPRRAPFARPGWIAVSCPLCCCQRTCPLPLREHRWTRGAARLRVHPLSTSLGGGRRACKWGPFVIEKQQHFAAFAVQGGQCKRWRPAKGLEVSWASRRDVPALLLSGTGGCMPHCR